jgi:hypothetical protein
MHSYIEIFNFTPTPEYRSLEALRPTIRQSMHDQHVADRIGEESLDAFEEKIVASMQVYYDLVGITDEVIESHGGGTPKGLLPRFTESLIGYFQTLSRHVPDNKEISVLHHSGVSSIKIRYKYTDSVIKKLVKLGLRNPDILDAPEAIFFRGGALHDLIGMLFVCSSPYEREWVARALYSFFAYDHRTDDHLVYGFYTVKRKSGYRGLHCDHSIFEPHFDAAFIDSVPLEAVTFDPAMSDEEVLRCYRHLFNI